MERIKNKLLREFSSVKFYSIITLFTSYFAKQIDQTTLIIGILGILGIRELSDIVEIITKKNSKEKKQWMII